MNHFNRFISLLPALLALFTAPWAQADAPPATIDQLSGWVMAVKADGKIKALAAGSKVEAGDTLVTEKDSFARLALGDGNDAILGPQTTLEVQRPPAQATHLSLAAGALQVTSTDGRLTLEVAGNTLGGKGIFTVNYVPAASPALAVSQQSYLHNSFAAIAPSVVSDAGSGPRVEWVAQNIPVPPLPTTPPSLAPGLYVHVTDGLILVTNPAGVQAFAAGQFGFTPSIKTPPVVLPQNPGVRFTPPPVFSQTSTNSSSNSNAKSNVIDCVVR